MSQVKEKPHTEEAQQASDEAQQQKELAAFERFYTAAKKRLAEAGDKINAATFKNALDKAISEVKEAGDYSAQTVKRVTQALKKDISQWSKIIENDFERPITSQFPKIAEIKKILLLNGATYASLSGSGSTVFGIFVEKPDTDGWFGSDHQVWQQDL